MAYRRFEHRELCCICTSPTGKACLSCDAPHCPTHLRWGTCPECRPPGTTIRRGIAPGMFGLYLVLSLPVFLVGLLLLTLSSDASWVGGAILFLLPFLFFTLPLVSESVDRS